MQPNLYLLIQCILYAKNIFITPSIKSLTSYTKPSGHTMYKLMQFVDISDGHPGMLIPIFSSNSTNLPYVQQMDEYFQIREMLPFLDYENYSLVLAERGRTVGVGDRGLVAFRSTDHSIVYGNTTEIIEYIGLHRELIQRSAHLDSQLRRIEGEKLSSMYEPWRLFAKESFERPD